MNYKRIIKNKAIRIKILKFFNFIPDKTMIKMQYFIKNGTKLNLNNPKRFTEKIQLYKIMYRNNEMTKCVDKYEVREYVKKKGLEYTLNELYGVWDNADNIDFDKLPNSFILKTTNGSQTNIICKDKNKLNIEETRKKLNGWLREKREKLGREWAYYNVKPRIICEKLLSYNIGEELPDYKFLCFDGEPYCLYFINGRKQGERVNLGIFDLDFKQLPYYRADENELKTKQDKPKNFEEMIEIARKLSSGFPHVRVDMYNINGKIIFGEMTFYDGSGYQRYQPDEFDYILGNQFKLMN